MAPWWECLLEWELAAGSGRGKSEARFTRSYQAQRRRTQQNIVDGDRFEEMKMEDGAEKQSWGQAASPRGDGALNDGLSGERTSDGWELGLMASGEGPMQCNCIDSAPQNPGNRTRTRDEAGKRRQSPVVRRLGGQRASEGAILGALPRRVARVSRGVWPPAPVLLEWVPSDWGRLPRSASGSPPTGAVNYPPLESLSLRHLNAIRTLPRQIQIQRVRGQAAPHAHQSISSVGV